MEPGLPKRIPLFPLPATVLFPNVPLPLHIFEERYRAMMHDALAGPGVIGMVLLRPGWETNYDGRPPIFQTGCAGIIAQHEKLPDGKYNLILLGQRKFVVEEEHEGKPYRLATVRYVDEDTAIGDETVKLRAKAISLINSMAKAASGEGEGEPLDPQHSAIIPDAEFVNYLCHILAINPLEKQALLEENSTLARYQKLVDVLDFWRLGAGKTDGTVQ